jgi:hypothetical protein
MPLLEVIQSRQISASVRFDETTATLVDQYAAFIHATADDVVNKALHYVFAKDRDFQDYLKSSDARHVTPTLRVRQERPSSRHEAQAHTKGHCRGGVDRVSQAGEAMILPENQWPEGNGASHRLYLDTPPLKGWRSLPIGGACYRERNQ